MSLKLGGEVKTVNLDMGITGIWRVVTVISPNTDDPIFGVFGEFHELYSPWRCKESETTERLSLSLSAVYLTWNFQNIQTSNFFLNNQIVTLHFKYITS